MHTTQKEIKRKEIKEKYEKIEEHLNEKTKRLWAAIEAKALGYGGVTLISNITSMSRVTIHSGLDDLEDESLPTDRIRRSGGGRKKLTDTDPTLADDLDTIMEPDTRGDPESPLRWTCKSAVNIAKTLKIMGHTIGSTSVRTILKSIGFSLQSNRKTLEGASHPDRDKQFRYINDTVKAFQKKENPVISVDTKKKELIGNFKQNGKQWKRKGKPTEVNTHDFPDKELGKVAPYGVYDVTNNEGWVNVGITKDTAEFAVQSIRTWWNELGKKQYHHAKEIFITADSGGSNGSRIRLWKKELQTFANETGIIIHVSHFPPGTSKWNKIEHRMFSFISRNLKSRPLIDRATVINLIANTTTKTGLKVYASLDERVYEKGIKVSDAEMAQLNLIRKKWHGDWNYIIKPQEG